MSNPAVYLLSENYIRGTRVRIEDNIGESIHIHYGALRISLTVKEFEQLYVSICQAVKELLLLEGIEADKIEEAILAYRGGTKEKEERDVQERKSASYKKTLMQEVRTIAHSFKVGYLNRKREANRNKHIGEMPSISNVASWLEQNQIDYYIIDYTTILNGMEICASIVVNDLQRVRERYGFFSENGYEGYEILYSVSNPILLYTLEGKVMVWDCLCCKSRFEDDILPLDKYCNRYAWEHIIKDKQGIKHADTNTTLLYLITTCMLEKLSFSKSDTEYITNSIAHLDDSIFRTMLEKEFFFFTDTLILLLRESRYDETILKYVTFIDY